MTSPGAAPLSQPWLFQRLRWLLMVNGLRTLIASSPVRLISILLSVVIVWAADLGVCLWGFRFLESFNVDLGLVGDLLGIFFLSVSLLLILSTGLILYASLFKGPETAFLLSLPAAADQVFGFRFLSAVGLSSLAFLWLGSPPLLAYGIVYNAPWYYYLLLPLDLVGFVLVPGAVGGLLALLVVRYVPRRRRQLLAVVLVLALLGLGTLLYLMIRASVIGVGADPLEQVLGYLAFARSPVLPSVWITRGVQEAGWGHPGEALYHLALLVSNGLVLYMLAAWVAGRLYRRAYDRLTTGTDFARRPDSQSGLPRRLSVGAALDAALARLLRFLDPQTRVLIVKDFRTFRREPIQWVQIVIFVVLMLLYFQITRNFYQQDIGQPFRNGVSLLNVSVTGLLMCAYTGRFIYPLLSLEGRKFWLLGLLPLKREKLLWGKFFFSAASLILPAEYLIVVSDLLLGISPLAMALHALTMLVLALGLSGLSIGIGATLPNFKETDPSKIAVGFGGTLNLIVGLLFLVLVVGLAVGPYHLYVAHHPDAEGTELLSTWWLYGGVVLAVGVGSAAVAVPMRLGIRSLRRMEF